MKARSTGARERLEVGLVGVGRWGKNHLRVLGEHANVAAICDTSEAALEAARAGFPDALACSTLEALLRSLVDVVVLATPMELHGEQALAALRAKKHVLVEKPLAMGVSAAKALVREAEASGCVLYVGHLTLRHPSIEALTAAVRRGDLGSLEHFGSSRTSSGARTSRENAIWSLAPHDVALALQLFGALPVEVEAQAVRGHDHVIDAVRLELSMPGGATAVVQCSRLGPPSERLVTVRGSVGSLRVDESAGLAETPLVRQWLDCEEQVRGSKPRSTGQLGLDVVRVLDAAETSVSTRRPVSLGPLYEPLATRANQLPW